MNDSSQQDAQVPERSGTSPAAVGGAGPRGPLVDWESVEEDPDFGSYTRINLIGGTLELPNGDIPTSSLGDLSKED